MKQEKTCGNCGFCDLSNDREGFCQSIKSGKDVVLLVWAACSFWKERADEKNNYD